MTSNYYPSCCKNVSRFPYVDRVSVGDNNDVNFIYQFVKHCTEYNESFVYNPLYIIGPPNKFPDYGELPQIFCMESRDLDISVSPWQDKCLSPNYKVRMNKQHIDIVFYEAVYPIRVSIYETYNPGDIIRIWAQDSDNKWRLLWEGSRQIVPPTSRLFSPPLSLQSCNFKTKSLRLEFKPSTWNYCTELDAVMLIGTSKLILPRDSEESLNNLLRKINFMYLPYENEDVHNLTTDYRNAHLDIVHLQENFYEYYIIRNSYLGETFFEYNLDHEKVSWEIIPDNMQCLERTYCPHSFPLKSNLNSVKRMKLSLDESVELPHCNFSSFSDEVILKVLKNLDLKSLCRMSQVNKRLNNLTRDWSLYPCLNVRNVVEHRWLKKPMYHMFCYFTLRCKYLQQLDLTGSEFSSGDFENFLDNCGRYLTHLRLSRSSSVNNTVLLKISKICKNLKELDLRFCDSIDNDGYSYLENLEHLEHLSISYTFRCTKVIKAQTFCKILQKNQQMHELSLDLASVDVEVTELRFLFRNLEEINLNYPFYLLTSQSINTLADCKNLRKITIRAFAYAPRIFDDSYSLNRLLSSCQRLEEVHLYRCLTDDNLNSLTECKNLKKLYLYDMKLVTSDLKYSIIFEQCPKLQELYFIYCNITKDLIKQWRETYPHVSVFVKTETYVHYQIGQHISASS